MRLRTCLLLIAWAAQCLGQQFDPASLEGQWKSTFKSEVSGGTVTLELHVGKGGTVSGRYYTDTGSIGTLEGTLEQNQLHFTLKQMLEECPGTFSGTLTVHGDQGSGTFSGSDCLGDQGDGKVQMSRITSGGVAAAASGETPKVTEKDETSTQWATLETEFRNLQDQHKYRQAIAVAEKALRVAMSVYGPEHLNTALSLNDLGAAYQAAGDYAKAEPLKERAFAILEKELGPDDLSVANALDRLGSLYLDMGKYDLAEARYQRALQIREKILGPEHPDVGDSLNNLAVTYADQGNYGLVEPLYKRALEIYRKHPGDRGGALLTALNNLARLYAGNRRQALDLLDEGMQIAAHLRPEDDLDLAMLLNTRAALYSSWGRYLEAEPLYQRALRMTEKILGPEHPDVATALENLGFLYWAEGAHVKAGPLLDQALLNLHNRFQYHFTYMTEKQRLAFLATVSSSFKMYFSFCVIYSGQNPELAGKMYDVILWEKGFIGQSMAALRARVAASGDPEALKLLEDLAAKKTQLATLLNAQPEDREAWRKQVAGLQQQADELEKQLVQRSSSLQQEKKLETATWRDVQKALKPGEAAVEVVSFQFHDGKQWTTRWYYVALVVRPESKLPELVVLDDGSETGTPRAVKDYQQLIGKIALPGAGRDFYQTFWQPLERALGDAKTVYLAPDGALNQAALGVVPTADGKLLMEKYDLRIVTNTKDLLRELHLSSQKTATLVGNPKFLLSEDEQKRAIAAFHMPSPKPAGAQPVLVASAAVNPMAGVRSRDLEQRSTDCPGRPAEGVLCPLPSTAVEIAAIQKLLSRKSWVVATYHDEQALEEAVKAVRHPRVLHLSTHGFFLSDQQIKHRAEMSSGEQASGIEDPMLRSGLLLAGADRVFKHDPPLANADDGVLTAYEASGLDLNGTELVVLSACETGLGEARAGEGVFGLRRALQVAGAEAVLMSMWKVPDRETEELMTSFYGKWLSGKDKHQALREAQMELRQKIIAREGHDIPYYWGAWVLVGK